MSLAQDFSTSTATGTTSVPWFQNWWATNIETLHPFYVYGVGIFAVHQVAFWTLNLPFILLQFNLMPNAIAEWFHKRKLQQVRDSIFIKL